MGSTNKLTKAEPSFIEETAHPFYSPMNEETAIRMATLLGEMVVTSLSGNTKTLWGIDEKTDQDIVSRVLEPLIVSGSRDIPGNVVKSLLTANPITRSTAAFFLLCKVDQERLEVPPHNNVLHLMMIYASAEPDKIKWLTPFLVKRLTQDLCTVYRLLRQADLAYLHLPKPDWIGGVIRTILGEKGVISGRVEQLHLAFTTAMVFQIQKIAKRDGLELPRPGSLEERWYAEKDGYSLVSAEVTTLADLSTLNRLVSAGELSPYGMMLRSAKKLREGLLATVAQMELIPEDRARPKALELIAPNSELERSRVFVEEIPSPNNPSIRFWFSKSSSKLSVFGDATLKLPFSRYLVEPSGANKLIKSEDLVTTESLVAMYTKFIRTFATATPTSKVTRFPFRTYHYRQNGYHLTSLSDPEDPANQLVSDIWLFCSSASCVLLAYLGSVQRSGNKTAKDAVAPDLVKSVPGVELNGVSNDPIPTKRGFEFAIDRFDGQPAKMGQFALNMRGMRNEYRTWSISEDDAVLRYRTVSSALRLLDSIVVAPEKSDATNTEPFPTMIELLKIGEPLPPPGNERNELQTMRFRFYLAMAGVLASASNPAEQTNKVREIEL